MPPLKQVNHTTKHTVMTFEAIYQEFNKKVFRYIKSRIKDELIVEELTSDVMVKVHQKLNTFDPNKAQMSTWIMNIAKNQIIDHFRKKQLNTVSLDNVYIDWANGDEEAQPDHLMALCDTELDPLDTLIEAETSQLMVEKYQTLSEIEQLIAGLHYFDGLSYDDIASQLNMPLGTVKAKLHNARVRLMESVPVEMRKLKVA